MYCPCPTLLTAHVSCAVPLHVCSPPPWERRREKETPVAVASIGREMCTRKMNLPGHFDRSIETIRAAPKAYGPFCPVAVQNEAKNQLSLLSARIPPVVIPLALFPVALFFVLPQNSTSDGRLEIGIPSSSRERRHTDTSTHSQRKYKSFLSSVQNAARTSPAKFAPTPSSECFVPNALGSRSAGAVRLFVCYF